MAVLQDININVHGQPSEKRLQTFLRLSQNENGRMINFRVLGAPLPSNCTATFSGTKPDGNVYSKTGTVTGNFVVIEEDIQMTAVAGVWDAKLDIINGTHNIMTALIRVVVDADVVDPDAIASDSQLQGLVAEAKYYAEHARTDAYGSPLTATTAAEMTDKTRVYVYTGSESGMTAGNWYYWNGSAWVSGGVYNAVAVQTDTTLSISGKAADAKKTGDEISSLREDLNAVKAVTVGEVGERTTTNIRSTLTWEDGNMNLNGGVGTGSDKRHSNKFAVNEGDIIAYQNANFLFNYVTAFNGDTAVSEKGVINVNSYTVPSGVTHLVLSEYTSRGTAAINHTTTVYHYENILDNDIAEIKSNIEDINNAFDAEEYTDETITNIFPDITWTSGYVDKAGSAIPSNDYRYSNKIAVSTGDVVSFQNVNFTFRFITAFSDESTAVSASGASDTNSYTVPEGINYVVLSEYVSRGTAAIIHAHYETKTAYNIKPIPLGYMLESGSLASGERLTLPYMQVKNFNRIVFNANITTFSSVRYSLGTAKVEVNATNLLITNANGTVLNPIPHGLTIGKNITLLIETETEEYINHVRISSDGAVFDYNTKFFAQSVNSSQYIESVGSALTECVLSWVSQNVNAPVWVFGDSYLSWYPERWTYYLAQDGFVKNAMLNGFAGQGSSTAYTALVNLLSITTPKIVVWCLGMNDPDTSSAVSASWKAYYDKIIELQKKYGFELVLYTVPTTPTQINTHKNALIRSSGYRYIEADKAVRIDDSGHWVGNGTAQASLATDNVHPTVYGAKILYNRILADLPEIMCNM